MGRKRFKLIKDIDIQEDSENELLENPVPQEIKELIEERDMHRDAAKDCGYIIKELQEEIRKLEERIRFLEECLDNKEKVNKSLREELQRYKEMWDAGED